MSGPPDLRGSQVPPCAARVQRLPVGELLIGQTELWEGARAGTGGVFRMNASHDTAHAALIAFLCRTGIMMMPPGMGRA